MNYFDDILNVSALLQSKAQENRRRSKELMQSYSQLQAEYKSMNAQADELLDTVRALAAEQGIDTSSISEYYDSLPTEPVHSDLGELLISLPPDFDFSAEFARLVEEAHEAGFTNVHPEALLTAEEMAHAESFRQALDDRFEQATQLTKKDIILLTTAVVLRSFCYYLFHALRGKKTPAVAEPQLSPGLNTAPAPTAIPIDAAAGVDLDAILKSSGTSHSVNTAMIQAGDIAGFFTKYSTKTAQIRDEFQILHEQVPFDLPDNDYFKHSDIVGFHPQLGWLVGVINILTNTVTTYGFDTFSVVPSIVSGLPHQIGQELSTLMHVLLPVAQNCKARKESLLAAVVREADVLNISKAPMEEVAAILENTMYYGQQDRAFVDKMSIVSDAVSFDLHRLIGDTGMAAFLDLLISAIHAIHYDPETDGDSKQYAIRTNKILLISSALATAANSSQALLTKSLLDVDISGLFMTFLKVINSTRFWIDVKTDYLVSEYRNEIEKENEKLEKYFI